MLTTLTSLVSIYGYWMVFGLIVLESLGLPLPGETMLIVAGAYAATGHLSITGVIMVGLLGAIVGDIGGYWIGRSGGSALLARFIGSRYKDHLQKGNAFFNRYGSSAVLFARFVPVVRVISANLAGITRMRFWLFSLSDIVGGIVWATVMGILGFVFGNNLPVLDKLLQRLGLGMVVIIVFLALVIWVARRLTRNESRIRHVREMIWERLGLTRLQQLAMQYLCFPRGQAALILGGFLAAILAGWLFGAIAEDVVMKDSLTLYDVAIGKWFLPHATEDSNEFFYIMTQLGSVWAIGGGSLLITSWLVWRKKISSLIVLLASVGGGILLNELLKKIFLRPRPDFVNAFYHETGYSFPSGHSMMSILFYGMAAFLLANQLKAWKWRVWLGTSAFTLALLIGTSRLALGVHFLTDVLGGWGAGVAWLMTCVIVYELALSRSKSVSLLLHDDHLSFLRLRK
jgi:membrane protein DedA with SNARE-associated domain/membrane-associated phospholipid phosphatase